MGTTATGAVKIQVTINYLLALKHIKIRLMLQLRRTRTEHKTEQTISHRDGASKAGIIRQAYPIERIPSSPFRTFNVVHELLQGGR